MTRFESSAAAPATVQCTRIRSVPHFRRAGLSLLEVLVAMFILSIGATSVLALYASAAATHRRSVQRTHAALIAERILSEAEARYHAGVTAEDLLARLRRDVEPVFGGFAWELDLAEPGRRASGGEGFRMQPARESDQEGGGWQRGELAIRIRVRWKESGRPQDFELVSVILPRNPPYIERTR